MNYLTKEQWQQILRVFPQPGEVSGQAQIEVEHGIRARLRYATGHDWSAES